MRSVALGALGLVMAFAAGCGSSVDTGNQGGGGGTGGSTTTTTTGTGGGDACAAFDDQTGPGTVVVRFRNDSLQPVYLQGLCGGVDYSIDYLDDAAPENFVFDGSCLQTCDDLRENPPFACGACAPIIYRLEPGGTREVVWSGTHLIQTTMPAACFESPDFGTQCSQILAAPSGLYRASAVGYEACTGDCTCDATGECFGMVSGMTAYSDPVKFEFPSEKLVEVVFGVCAFGCAGQ